MTPQAVATRVARRVTRPRPVAAALFAVVVVLTLDAMLRGRGDFDYELMRAVQAIRFPGDSPVLTFVSDLTGNQWAPFLWALLVVGCLLARRALAATLLLVFPLAGGVNLVLRGLVGRTRPDPGILDPDRDPLDVARILAANDYVSFPSGHVVGAVLLYGFVFALASEIRQRPIRLGIQGICAGVIVLSGVARVWLGSHWVGDVVAGYALGGGFLFATTMMYRAMAPTTGRVPLVRAQHIPHDESLPHAHALTSTLLFRDGRVYKIYAPGYVPRLAYWLAFQAPFAYENNPAALRAAVLRRNLAGLLTEYWYGDNRVARAIGVEVVDGRLAIVGQFTDGVEPNDHAQARAFLFGVADHFDQAGLPTWQIDPRQPRSLGNLLEGSDGKYTVIDLESGMVSPLASPRAWWRAFRRSEVPLYDDVYFDITRAYVDAHAGNIEERFGTAWLANLQQTLADAEREARAWHAGEPRIWSRFMRAAWTAFGLRTFPGWVKRKADRGRAKADEWIDRSISTWEAEGRLSAPEASDLRASLLDPGIQEMLPHFGVHLIIGVALRFPFGSIARASYTAANLILASGRLLFRRISFTAWRRLFGIHSPLVIVVAAVPGVGTFAYLVSWPVLRHFLLARVTLDAVGEKLPWGVYRRFGFRRIICRPARAGSVAPPHWGGGDEASEL